MGAASLEAIVGLDDSVGSSALMAARTRDMADGTEGALESINFRVDSSLGELDVWLNADAWAQVEMCDPSPEIPMVEQIVRSEGDLSQAFTTIGLPPDEASELAEELWEELDPQEREEREAFRLPGETGDDTDA